jgi:hypothetical protein
VRGSCGCAQDDTWLARGDIRAALPRENDVRRLNA